MNIATFIRRDGLTPTSFHKRIDQRIYRVSEPVLDGFDHVLVSAVEIYDRTRPSGTFKETMIFACDADGNDSFLTVLDPMMGVFDHDAALRQIGCVPLYPVCG